MMNSRVTILCGVASVAFLAANSVRAAAPVLETGYSSGWFSQIHLTSAIQAQAYDGKGITIGFVDSGIIATRPEFTGRVSTASSCAAVTFKCSNGYYDDTDHGTAVAGIGASANNA